MDFLDLVQKRYSVRSYKPDPVEDDKLAQINVAAARHVFGIPDQVQPALLSPLGYPAGEPRPKTRKNLTDLVRYEKW
jgi:nitroreductase